MTVKKNDGIKDGMKYLMKDGMMGGVKDAIIVQMKHGVKDGMKNRMTS